MMKKLVSRQLELETEMEILDRALLPMVMMLPMVAAHMSDSVDMQVGFLPSNELSTSLT